MSGRAGVLRKLNPQQGMPSKETKKRAKNSKFKYSNFKSVALGHWLVLSGNVKCKIENSRFDREKKSLLLSYMQSESVVVDCLIAELNAHAMGC